MNIEETFDSENEELKDLGLEVELMVIGGLPSYWKKWLTESREILII